MGVIGSLINLIVFYSCFVAFFWNFNSFSFQEKVIVLLIMSGFHCLSSICYLSK